MNSIQNSILISIGMPVFNAGVFLKDAVESIINQSYTNWELIIIDDGSTDNAVKQLEADGVLSDQRIRLYSDGKNKGLAARLNEAIDLSRGLYFARMDQDDISLPNRLEEQLKFLTNHPEIDLLSTRVETINFDNQIVGNLPYALTHDAICAKPWRSFYMPHPTWMGKLTWFKQFRYAYPAPYFCEDQELLLRAYETSKFACLNHHLLLYRVRNKINYNKTIKTHFSLFKYQIKKFSNNNIIYTIMSCLVLLGRIIKVNCLYIKGL